MGCKQCRLCKVLHGIVQGFGKGFDKGAAAGGTGFVKLDTVYRLAFNFDAFHVLAADIQDTVYLGIEKRGGIIVCHCLYFPVIQQKSRLHKCFPISCGAGAHNTDAFRKLGIDFPDCPDGGL